MVELFTHTDLDGVGCAVLAKLTFGDMVNIEYCNYDDIDNAVEIFIQDKTISDNDMCFITDISVREDVADRIDKKFNNFYLLDHHPTAINLNKYDWCNVQIQDSSTGIKTSGTELYYRWLVDNGYLNENIVLQKFVELIRNYDTWLWSSMGNDGVICKQINDLLYMYGRDKFIHWCLSEIHDSVFPKLYPTEELLLKLKQEEIDSYIESKNKEMFTGVLCGYICGFVFAEKYPSELGNKLCVMHPEIDCVAIIDMGGTVSYRTIKEDVDLGKDVAKVFGGGGHSKAAGSQFSKEVCLKVVENIFAK